MTENFTQNTNVIMITVTAKHLHRVDMHSPANSNFSLIITLQKHPKTPLQEMIKINAKVIMCY